MKKVIGITGGIACGKTNISNIVKEKYYLIDCDEITHRLWDDKFIIKEALNYFGKEILDGSKINRKTVGKIVFHNQEKLNWLNNLFHPLIIKKIKEEIKKTNEELVFIDAPILFETNLDTICDIIICAYLPLDLEIERLMHRDNISKAEAINIINKQMDLNLKAKMSDYVIDTSGTFLETRNKVLDVLEVIACH